MGRKKKIKDINIIDLSKEREKIEEEQNRTPEIVIEKLEMLVEKAKEGKLNIAIVHFDYDIEEEEGDRGGTLLWNKNNNILEILGLIEIIKDVAKYEIEEEEY